MIRRVVHLVTYEAHGNLIAAAQLTSTLNSFYYILDELNPAPPSSARDLVGETVIVALNSMMSDCHIVTPLILSEPLGRLAGQKVYLKLDSLQPSGNWDS